GCGACASASATPCCETLPGADFNHTVVDGFAKIGTGSRRNSGFVTALIGRMGASAAAAGAGALTAGRGGAGTGTGAGVSPGTGGTGTASISLSRTQSITMR